MTNVKLLCMATGYAWILLTISIPETAHAVDLSLDWGEISQTGGWSSGQESGRFEIGSGAIAISTEKGGGVSFVEFGNGNLTPAINSILNGTASNDDPSLHLQIDAEQVGLGEGDYSVKLITRFEGYRTPLTNVSFPIYDIDIAENYTWQDRVIVQGFLGDRVVTPVFDWLYDDANTIEQVNPFTVDGTAVVSNDTDTSNVLISFVDPIDRFELVFTDGDDVAIANPLPHGIGIGNIHFSEPESVPEPSSLLGLMTVGLILGGLRLRKQSSS
jgi:hypothetical protein